jgi:hypothetical protein
MGFEGGAFPGGLHHSSHSAPAAPAGLSLAFEDEDPEDLFGLGQEGRVVTGMLNPGWQAPVQAPQLQLQQLPHEQQPQHRRQPSSHSRHSSITGGLGPSFSHAPMQQDDQGYGEAEEGLPHW